MGRLVGAFGASHAPLMVREWESAAADVRERVTGALREIGRRIAAARTDVLVIVSPDHWVNFFINNMPSVCICVGAEHVGPPEPWMKAFPYAVLNGHPEFANHLARTALANDFEPALSHRLELDHGICIPLWKSEMERLPALVPVILNTVEPPMVSVRRCDAWGDLIRRAIESYPEDIRVAVLATGGLSHSIGEPDMGRIDEPFDRQCLERLQRGDRGELIRFLEQHIEDGGNGAAEVRNWVIAHAAAGGRGFESLYYHPIHEWYVGCCWAAWNVDGAAH